MVRLFYKILRNLHKIKLRIDHHLYYWRFQFAAKLADAGLSVGKKCYWMAPVDCRGARGRIVLGKSIRFGFYSGPKSGNGEILLQPREADSVIKIGDDAKISNNVSIIARKEICIGKQFLCGDHVMIIDADFHPAAPSQRFIGEGECRPIKIGDNVWLGSRVIVLKGANIGDNSIVAAGSVVAGELPENTICGGIPARVLKILDHV